MFEEQSDEFRRLSMNELTVLSRAQLRKLWRYLSRKVAKNSLTHPSRGGRVSNVSKVRLYIRKNIININ